MNRQAWLDGIAGTTSLVCLVHCLALPLLFAALPALGDALNVPEAFHRYAVLAALPASALALLSGYRRHRSVAASLIGASGLGAMAWAAFAVADHSLETMLTVTGSLIVAAAHLLNWRRFTQARARSLLASGSAPTFPS